MKPDEVCMKRGCAVAVVAAVSMSCISAAFATDAYLAVQDALNTTSFTNCVNWRVGSVSGSRLGTADEPIKTGYDYIVGSGKTLRTPATSATFGGDSLTIGGGILALCASATGRNYTFPGNGLVLRGGGELISWAGHSPTVKGKVTVQGTTVEVYENTSTSVLNFDCDLVGESSSSLWVYGFRRDDGSDTSSTVCFKGETLKNYAGKIACSTLNYNNRNNTPNSKRASTVKIGSVVSPANVTIHAYCRLAAEAASDMVSLDTLVMKTNSAITVVYDKSSKTASCVKVSGTFTHDEGPVKIEFEPNSTFGSWPDSEIVPELQVLKAPEGVTLSTNDFVLSTSAVFPVYDLYERTAEDGLSTLCIKQRGKVIKQTTSEDSTGSSGTTFLSGSHWDGGELPATNNCYYSDKNKIRAYAEAFPGGPLAKKGGEVGLQKATVRIDDFRIIGGALAYIYNYSSGSTVLKGRLHLLNSDSMTRICGHGYKLTIESEIDGSSPLSIYWTKYSDTKFVSTVALTGTNDFFTGRITSSCSGGSDTKYNVLQFADGRSLGGAMPSWTYNGLTLADYTRLTPLASTSLDRKNCGIYVTGASRIVCNSGITLTVKERTTWRGEIKKLGAGTLAWGGAEPYFMSDGGTTPSAGSNCLVIANGTLRPASSEAFRGVAVTIADGAGIGVELQSDATSDLAKYGMDLRPAGSSLTIEAESLTPEVSFPTDGRTPLAAAICTVPAASAPALHSKLRAPGAVSEDLSVELFERTNADASVTFGIKVAKKIGLVIMVL